MAATDSTATPAYTVVEGRTAHYMSAFPPSQPEGKRLIVMLHQIASSGRMYAQLSERLTPLGFSVFAPDLPGFGATSPLSEAPTIAAYARWLDRFIDVVAGQRSVVLLGHHLGANVALETAFSFPGRVSHLILSGLPYGTDRQPRDAAWVTERMRARGISAVAPREGGEHLITQWNRVRGLSPESSLDLLQRELVSTLRAPRYDLAYRASMGYDAAPALAALNIPTLFIGSTRDTLFNYHTAAAASMPNASAAVIDGAGLFVMDEHPDAVASLIADFVLEPTYESTVAPH